MEELVMIAGNEMGCESPASSIDKCIAELFPEAILIFELVLAKTLSSFFFNSKNFVKRVRQFATSLERNIWVFSPLVPPKQEKNILVLLRLYIF